MKKILIILILGASMAGAWVHHTYAEFTSSLLRIDGDERILEIPQGASATAVAQLLEREGIVSSAWMMRYCFRESGLSNRLQPGSVVLKSGMAVREIPEAIARVGAYTRKSVQILPGMNLFEIGARLQTQRIADAKKFIAMAQDSVRAAEMGVPAAGLEGYLASGAYTFEAGTTSADVIDEMHRRWRMQWEHLVETHRGAYDQAIRRVQNDHALVTLASMVEKEALVASEKPVIARVFYNRLAKNMKIQSDPTCVYPPKQLGEKPTPERCRENQRYSTYVIAGLPPGPIATPSISSLEAVLEPYQGPDASVILYFVAKQDGSRKHYFSKTYAEHQIAVDYFLKGKKDKNPQGTTQP